MNIRLALLLLTVLAFLAPLQTGAMIRYSAIPDPLAPVTCLAEETLAPILEKPPEYGAFLVETPGKRYWVICRNDPVNNVDPLGLWAWDRDWIQMGVGGLFGAYGRDAAVSGWSGVGGGAKNEVIGAAKIVKETGAMVADTVNATAEITTGHSLYNGDLSSSMQSLSSGKTTAGAYYTDFGANVATLGTYGQTKATVQFFNDEISADEYSQQVGGAGIVQLVAAKMLPSGSGKPAPAPTTSSGGYGAGGLILKTTLEDAKAPSVPLKSVAAKSTAVSPFRYTRAGETFQHYSYAEQAESLATGLRPASYGTTAEGLTGVEAQQGLALRHASPPNAVYTVSPPAGTPIRVNPITRPQFGQPGGLSEVEFIMGTPPGSVSGPTLIPRGAP